ncbi:hypothetical protein ACTUVK_000450 [Stenotrophomonas rhizophila]
MHATPPPSSWSTLVQTLAAHGLADQISASAVDASWRRDGIMPEDAPSQAQFDALLPQAYRAFVAEHGYPLLAAPSELHYAFAFLPPRAARQVSTLLADEARPFAEVRAERREGRYTWRHVMFAGWNFADGDGWAFGVDPQAEGAPEPVVWLLEGGQVVEAVGSFQHWLAERAADVRSRVEALDADALAEAAAWEGDYAYGPQDLEGFDG